MIDSAKLLLVDAHSGPLWTSSELLRTTGWSVDTIEVDRAEFPQKLRNLNLEAYGLVLIETAALAAGTESVLADMRRKDPHLPILHIVDGQSSEAGAAADVILVRPFEQAEILKLIQVLVGLRGTRRAVRESETWLQLAQEAGGLAVMEIGLRDQHVRWSPKFAEIFQLPEGAKPKDVRQLVHSDDLPRLLLEYKSYLQNGDLFERDFRIVRRDQSVRWVAAHGKLVRDARGRAERVLFLCSDITERKEAELRNAQLAAIVASSIDAIVSIDGDDRILTWNHGAERLFGYAAEDVLGGPCDIFVPNELKEERRGLMNRLTNGEAIEYHTLRRRKDGRTMNVWIRGAPIRGSNGDLVGGSLIIRDVTAQHQHEEHIRLLMRELTHRSKNLLAVIQAMAQQTLSYLTTPEDFVSRFSERLSGLAGSHDLLSRDDWAGASLVQLIRSQLQHYSDLFDSRIIIDGPDLFLRPEAAQNIGIALHELSTNAAKFGALSVPEGSVTIAWRFVSGAEGERRLDLTWTERDGPPVVAPDHKGFGHMVMHRITGQALGGRSTLQFDASGVSWHLDVPMADVIRANTETDPDKPGVF